MGSAVKASGNHATRKLLRAYLSALGNPKLDLKAIPIEDGFAAARRFVNSMLELPSPERLDHEECRLDWNGLHCEGKCVPGEHTADFICDNADAELPEIGTEARLRFPGGSQRVLILQRTQAKALIARAPHRQERRTHKRSPAGGYAVVKLGGKEAKLDLRDISEGGAGLASEFIIETGRDLEMLLRIEGKKGLSFECEGLVVNCRKPPPDARMECWLGVQFTKIPNEMRDEIRRLMREETP